MSDARRGSSRRCHGYLSADGQYGYCSRDELAGAIAPQGRSGLFAHRLTGSCRCGVTHGAEPATLDVERFAAEIAAEDARRAQLLVAMPSTWAELDARSIVGENYLRSRAVAPSELRHAVRFSAAGEPALSMRATDTGAITGIQYRKLEGEQKVIGQFGSVAKGAALHGRLAELDSDGVDVAVLVEGVVDTLTAIQAFPGCAIFGAPGAGHLGSLATAIAERVLEVRGWLLIVPDDDDDGVRNAARAVKAAQKAGLVLENNLHVVDLGDAHDLNDAWGGGWRWSWPSECGGAA